MGLTTQSTGKCAACFHRSSCDAAMHLVALAGNPNVGKSTVFNQLTGLRQHTGNWPGKTVGNAFGSCTYHDREYLLADLPGAYSLAARSAEEEVARDLISCGEAEAIVVVCDATCLKRSLFLAVQILEITGRVVVCVNLLDEAQHRGIQPDLAALEARLGVPVVGTCAGKGQGFETLLSRLEQLPDRPPLSVDYDAELEAALQPLVERIVQVKLAVPPRWTALRLLENDRSALTALQEQTAEQEAIWTELFALAAQARATLPEDGLSDRIAETIAAYTAALCDGVVEEKEDVRSRTIDRIVTNKILAFPLMALLLAGILWLTISGANIPSAWLSNALFRLGDTLERWCAGWGMPLLLRDALFSGVYRTVAWVVSVMLPPMAIFFPLFTLLEDLGYLPRIAFNLDSTFRRCSACGKQGLTMCMGFGCNAAGVVGCRIIDSPRERMIAILTNSFVPCNGRFPTMIALITIFLVGTSRGSSLLSALILTGIVLIGIFMTFLMSWILSKTLLRGMPSSFVLELPPFRKPQIGKVIVRSILDRTLFVLSRAVAIALPAGLVIWLLANLNLGGVNLLQICSAFLDPAARWIGLDGVILLAFLLGLPANEIVIPIILMCYCHTSSLTDYGSLMELQQLLTANGWTAVTALCVVLFSLMHWPCSTTLLTIRKETGKTRWMLLAALLPTLCGVVVCALVNWIAGSF
ncbi:MAG: ferrous iron transport protein B [Oscillospiraceae bacterium]